MSKNYISKLYLELLPIFRHIKNVFYHILKIMSFIGQCIPSQYIKIVFRIVYL